jgi:hypothetical protein
MLVHLLYRRGGIAAHPQQRISLRFSKLFASFGVSVIIPYFSQNCQLHFVIFLSSFVFFRRLVFFAKKFWKT